MRYKKKNNSSMIQVVDNFLPEDNFKRLQKAIMTPVTFPWYYVPHLADVGDLKEYYFIHFFYESVEHPPSQHFPLISKLLFKLNCRALIRAKANLFLSTPKVHEHEIHTDYIDESKSCVFSLNTNNGYTRVGNEKIPSVANRAVIFPSKLHHRATSCSDQQIRVNININYYV
tara:strand:+ start:4671 stop:5186 length:516 start_codon:yes stop_codon:yes gene_type:complete